MNTDEIPVCVMMDSCPFVHAREQEVAVWQYEEMTRQQSNMPQEIGKTRLEMSRAPRRTKWARHYGHQE